MIANMQPSPLLLLCADRAEVICHAHSSDVMRHPITAAVSVITDLLPDQPRT
jgi:hypothetical protein